MVAPETSPTTPPEDMKYTECYCAFLDILGLKQMVKRSQTDPQLLFNLIRGLNYCAGLPETVSEKRELLYEGEKCIGARNERRWVTQIRAFSDSVLIFVPSETNLLADTLRKVRYLHDRLLELGCCLRGAVTLGGMYWNDAWSQAPEKVEPQTDTPAADGQPTILHDRNVLTSAFLTLGPALVEAHELESTIAVYPRVVFSPRLMAYIHKKSKAVPERETEGIHKAAHAVGLCAAGAKNHDRCLLDFIRTDGDGVPFLDLFHRDINHSDTERIVREKMDDGTIGTRWIRDSMTFEDFMRNTRSVIERFLQEQNPEKVCVKYLWLANYFNASLVQHNINPIPTQWNDET
jgi:hypothetical protein